jgi:hypothetical protein
MELRKLCNHPYKLTRKEDVILDSAKIDPDNTRFSER